MSRMEAEARELLLQRRRTLSRTAARGCDGDQAGSLLSGKAMPTTLAEGARRELADIEAALERIEEGRYGRCLKCGGPIGLQRLRAIPEARYCVSCSG
jgi:DnaK suppressor protein